MLNRRKIKVLITLLVTIDLITISISNAVADATSLRLIALDVGEGQSVLLQRGRHGILIDTGHAGKATYLLQKLQHYGVERLDYMILTHLHPDHASGYFRIREAFPDAPVLLHGFSFINTSAPDISRWVAEALDDDPYRRQFRAGDQLNWHGIAVKPLWPGKAPGKNMNDSSLVLEIHYGSRRVLLMGDAGNKVEQQLLTKGDLSGPYDALVAGHHGSKGTSSDAFLTAVSPAYSVVSINADNIRGYPATETIERLQQHSREKLLRTFDDGDVCLEWTSHSEQPVLCTQT